MVSNENYQAGWKHAWQVGKIRYLAQDCHTCHKIAELLDLYKRDKAVARKAYEEAGGGGAQVQNDPRGWSYFKSLLS